MSEANDLIERLERETGQRIDDDDSLAMAGLFGAIARLIGQSSHQERDDIVAGTLIQIQATEEAPQPKVPQLPERLPRPSLFLDELLRQTE